MAETESSVDIDRPQGQPRADDKQDVWNEWPQIHEQRLFTVLQRERVIRDQLIQRLQVKSEMDQKIREILRAKNPFRLLPDPPLPYASLPVKINE